MQKFREKFDNSTTTKILWIFFWLSILRQLSILKLILDQMSTTGKQFPLQKFLGLFDFLWNVIDVFWSTLLGSWFSYQIFENYCWGGFTIATIIWSIIKLSERPKELILNNSDQIKSNQKLLLIYMLFFMFTIIYGLDRDQWVPYVQEPSWEINLVHKQQISAGTFFIVYYIILCLSYFPDVRGHVGALNFINSRKIMTYTFLLMNLDNLASFSWFPGAIDPNNRWINGYEEIFQEGQNWTSTDKIFHFSMSSVAVIMILMFTRNKSKAIIAAISIVIFWELFEIALNPREASDSLLDMVINSTAIFITAGIFSRVKPETNSLRENNSNLVN